MSRPRSRWCLRNHDTFSVGRYPGSYRCIECQREDDAANPTRMPRGRRPAPPRLSSAPLLALMTRESATAAWMGYSGCSFETANRRADRLRKEPSITIDSADRWCVALGTHLAIVFPELYRESVA